MRTPGVIAALAWAFAIDLAKGTVQGAYVAYFLAASTGVRVRPPAGRLFDYGGDVVFLSAGLGMLAGLLLLLVVMSRQGEPPSTVWRCNASPRTLALLLLAALACFVASDSVLWLVRGRLTHAGTVELARSTTAPWLALFQVVVIAPVYEEWLARGFLLPHLARRLGSAWAVGITAVLWALIHTQYEALEMTMVAVLGVLLGIARLRTGGIAVPVMIHMLANVWASAEIAFVLRG